jgi:hypothetical protein
VQLGAGTFKLTSGILIPADNLVLRGQGADSTLLVFSGMSSCNGLYSEFCVAGSNSSPGAEQQHAAWKAGYAKGTTQITLSNSLGIAANSTLIILDQLDEAADTGNIWNCLGDDGPCGGGSGGFARTDNTCAGGFCSQEQQVLVTACSPSCNNSGSTVLTISPGLYMNNWSGSKSPGAWWANTTAYRRGVENLSADLSNAQPGTSTAVVMNCYQCWVRGIRSIMAARNHIYLYSSAHSEIRDNYFYQSTSHGSVSYGIESVGGSSDNLIENNITQQVTDSTPNNNGGGAGNVAAYNLALDDIYGAQGWMQPSDYEHAAGYNFWLREGNISIGFEADDVHGTHHFTTLFRNWFKGWQNSCGGGACTAQTTPIHLYAASRYFNVVGNVLGWPGYHSNYTCSAPSGSCDGNVSIYSLGFTANGGTGFCTTSNCSSHGNYDPLTVNSIMRWGNYDVVNNATRFVNTEAASSFADTTGNPSIYANIAPSGQTLPASLVHSSKPSWWGNMPWPAIGPDVTGGTVTAGSGPASTLGGHVYMNPAMQCYTNVMGGPADGSGSVLSFNADNCYGGIDPPPPPPTNLNAYPH